MPSRSSAQTLQPIRRVLLRLLAMLFVLLAGVPSVWADDVVPAPQATARPNILFIFSDDHATPPSLPTARS